MKSEKQFENIKMVISDFDGIFTDGKGIIDENGNVSKQIHYHDVLGIALLLQSGLKVAIITGEEAGAVKYIANKFKELRVFQGIKDKQPIVNQLAEEYKIQPEEILYIGDDVNDFRPLSYSGIKVTVPNANQTIKNIPDIIITEKTGGNGVFREITDAILADKLNKNFMIEGSK